MNIEPLLGKANYTFAIVSTLDSIFLNNFTEVSELKLNGKPLAFTAKPDAIWFKAPTELGTYNLSLSYYTKPKQTAYFVNADTTNSATQLWTQGQGKYTSHWLPSLDDMNDKIEFDLSFLLESDYDVIANGKLVDRKEVNGLTEWKYDMQNPMSSYLVAFAIGDFDKKQLISKSGVPLELYYEPKDSLKVEPTYRYSKEIFDFLEEEIGVPYPWQNYKQVPVHDFLYAGMENTSCTIFSNQYMIDSTAFVDKNYVNVNAHELAHQWFGNLVTEVDGNHHWLHEGFATYYAYLTENEIFGDDFLFWKLFETAEALKAASESGEGFALTNPKADSLTFYEKGAWALAILKELVGETNFKIAVQNYLKKHAYQNVTLTDFLSAIETQSGHDLSDFRAQWLAQITFNYEEALTFFKTKIEFP